MRKKTAFHVPTLENELHVWIQNVPECSPRRREQILSENAHLLVCNVLSLYCPNFHPEEWEFETNQYGCPSLAKHLQVKAPYFNISHSGDYVVCVFGRISDIGIDIEKRRPLEEIDLIAQSFFSKAERDLLNKCPPQKREFLFFKIWTLKESYIKARKMGVAIDLASFSFQWTACDQIILNSQDSRGWQFHLFQDLPNHQVAIGYRDLKKVVHEIKFYNFSGPS